MRDIIRDLYDDLYIAFYNSNMNKKLKQRSIEAQAVAVGCIYANHIPFVETVTQRDLASALDIADSTVADRCARFDNMMDDPVFVRCVTRWWKAAVISTCVDYIKQKNENNKLDAIYKLIKETA